MQKRFDAICKISDRLPAAGEPQGAKVLDFFAEDEQERVYIFSRKYRTNLFNYFRKGISTRNLYDFTKTRRSSVVINTILQLRTHLRFIEKEYGVEILEKRGENKKPKYNRRHINNRSKIYSP